MSSARRRQIPHDSLLQLRQRLDRLPLKSSERTNQINATAALYDVSVATVYRSLAQFNKPYAAHRVDHGKPRVLHSSELTLYCELVAALKLRTTNKSGRHLSTQRSIDLLENYGVQTANGLIQAPKGLLTRQTVNRYRKRTANTYCYKSNLQILMRFPMMRQQFIEATIRMCRQTSENIFEIFMRIQIIGLCRLNER